MRKPLLKTLFCLSLLAPFMGSGQDKNALEAGFVNPAEQGTDFRLLVLDFWEYLGRGREEGPLFDERSRDQPGFYREYRTWKESRRLIRPCRSIVRNGGKYCTQPLKQQRNWG